MEHTVKHMRAPYLRGYSMGECRGRRHTPADFRFNGLLTGANWSGRLRVKGVSCGKTTCKLAF
jgi:hypothetical protein